MFDFSIERGHEHHLQPVAKTPLPNGNTSIHSRCVCGLEEQRVFGGDDRPVSLKYRIGGVWFGPLNLLRLLPLPYEECGKCHGGATLEPCLQCGGLGVEAPGGGWLQKPDLTVTA